MNRPDEDNPSFKERVNFIIAFAMVFARVLELPFRKAGTAGVHYFGGHCAVSIVLMFVVISLVGGPPDQLIAFYAVGAAVFLVIVHKSYQKKLEAQGYDCHSQYSGKSVLDFGHEIRAKTSWEPAVAFATGLGCLTFSAGLAAWMLCASVCMGISASVARAEMEARRRALRDALFLQRAVTNGIA